MLDRETHYREFPATADARQAKAVIKQLESIVAPDADGTRHPTARQVKAAVAAVCPKSGGQKSEVRSRKSEVGSQESDPTSEPKSPRLAPETISGEYVEVQDVPPAADPNGTARRSRGPRICTASQKRFDPQWPR